jgi:hypothetical protein
VSDRSDTATGDPRDEEPVAEESDVPVGPTGRPLQPVGAYFEAAFRRFGVNFGGYLLYALAFGLIPLGTALIVAALPVRSQVSYFAFLFAFSLGFLLFTAVVTTLVAGLDRTRISTIAITCLIVAAIAAGLGTLFPPLMVVFFPLLVIPAIVAGAGDAEGWRAVPRGARLALRWFKRSYAVLLGVVLVAGATWFGFTILLTPLDDGIQRQIALALTTLVVWPVTALAYRNLYGDMTGRLVIYEAPGEDERRRELMRRRAEKAKDQRRRLGRLRRLRQRD